MSRNKEIEINNILQLSNPSTEVLSLENIETFSTPISQHQLKWMFEETQGYGVSREVKAQIIPLREEAAQFLINFRKTQQLLHKQIYQSSGIVVQKEGFDAKKQTPEAVKTWLSQKHIPLDRKVFWVNQLNVAFVMTWRMVIKFSDILFFGTDEVLWDKTMDWELTFDANEVFKFSHHSISNFEAPTDEATHIQDKAVKSNASHIVKEMMAA